MGDKNDEGKQMFDSSIVNTLFEKRTNHLVIYKSGGRESQIDFLIIILCGRQQLREIKNCKVIDGESVAAQHSELVLNW